MQGILFHRCTHLLYCNVLSLGGNVNTRRMSKPDMGSIFHIKNQWNILVIGKYYVNYQNYQNLMLSTSSNTKRTLHASKFRPGRTSFNMFADYTQLRLTFLALNPWLWHTYILLLLRQELKNQLHSLKQRFLSVILRFFLQIWKNQHTVCNSPPLPLSPRISTTIKIKCLFMTRVNVKCLHHEAKSKY